MLLRGALFHRILTEHFYPVGQLVLHRGHILALETGEVHGVEHGFVQALTGVHRTVIAGGIVHRIVINRVDEFPHDTLVPVSYTHLPQVSQDDLIEAVKREVIRPVLEPTGMFDEKNCDIFINTTGRFVVGGPMGDCGLTGRKLIQDSYGGMGSHGGGAFSGKDPSKVDRSAAYMARYVAKNVVAAGLAPHCEVQVAYCIGVADPVSVLVSSQGSGEVPDEILTKAVREVFDLRPYHIIKRLDLKRPIFQKTACYGHFGRELPEFTWEKTDAVQDLLTAAKV